MGSGTCAGATEKDDSGNGGLAEARRVLASSLMATTFGLASNHADSAIFPLGEFRNVVEESAWLRHDPH
jgi:hypothetical protein